MPYILKSWVCPERPIAQIGLVRFQRLSGAEHNLQENEVQASFAIRISTLQQDPPVSRVAPEYNSPAMRPPEETLVRQ